MQKIEIVIPIKNKRKVDEATIKFTANKWVNSYLPFMIKVGVANNNLIISSSFSAGDIPNREVETFRDTVLAAVEMVEYHFEKIGVSIPSYTDVIARVSQEDEWKVKQEGVNEVASQLSGAIKKIMKGHPDMQLCGSINGYGYGSIEVSSNEGYLSTILNIEDGEVTIE